MDEKISRFEIIGLLGGAMFGATPFFWLWFSTAQYAPNQWLFWGFSAKSFAGIAAIVGAVVRVCLGNAIRHIKSKPKL